MAQKDIILSSSSARGEASMAELTAGADLQERSRSFYVWVAGLCVFYAFGGFSTTYFMPMMGGTLREVTPAVHIHGILFFGWTLIFLLQSTLAARGEVARHRAVGMAGISIATAMVIFGLIVNFQFAAARLEDGAVDAARAYSLMFGGTISMLGFGTLFALAIVNLRQPEVHKRLMLFATCMILTAAVSRLWRPVFGGDAAAVPILLVFATIDIILVAGLAHDWRRLGRIHGATIAGVAAVLTAQLMRVTVPGTELWQSAAPVLLRLLG